MFFFVNGYIKFMELIFIRTIILFTVSVILIRLMGKRQIGELEPYEVVITIMIAEVAMTPMDDTKESILFGLLPIVTLYILHTFISYLSLKIVWFRNMVSGKSTMIIENGCILIENMRDNYYSMDELTEQLRQKGVFNIDEVEFAMIEADGTLSVLKKEHFKKVYGNRHLPQIIITCGKFQKECSFDKNTFTEIARKNGFPNTDEIFYASVSTKNKLFIQNYNKKFKVIDLGEKNDS